MIARLLDASRAFARGLGTFSARPGSFALARAPRRHAIVGRGGIVLLSLAFFIGLIPPSLAEESGLGASVVEASPVHFDTSYEPIVGGDGSLAEIRWTISLVSEGASIADLRPTLTLSALPGAGIGKPTTTQATVPSALDAYGFSVRPNTTGTSVSYSVVTPVTAKQPSYALDLFVQLAGYTAPNASNAVADTMAQRVIVEPKKSDGSAFEQFDRTKPILRPVIEADRTISGQYTSENAVTWTIVEVNRDLDRRDTATGEIVEGNRTLPSALPPIDVSQAVKKDSVALYTLGRVLKGATGSHATLTDGTAVPPGGVSIRTVETTVTDPKVFHSLGDATLESTVGAVIAARYWGDVPEDKRKPMTLSLSDPKDGTKSYSSGIATDATSVQINNVPRFEMLDGQLSRIDYSLNGAPLDGVVVTARSFDGVSSEASLSLADSKTVLPPEEGKYGIYQVDPVHFDMIQKQENGTTLIGFDSKLSMRWRIPAHMKAGESFRLTLPDEISINAAPSTAKPFSYIYDSQHPGDADRSLMKVFLLDNKHLLFVATENADSTIDLEGDFTIGSKLPVKGCTYDGVTYANGVVKMDRLLNREGEPTGVFSPTCTTPDIWGGVTPNPTVLVGSTNSNNPYYTYKEFNYTNEWLGDTPDSPVANSLLRYADIDWNMDPDRKNNAILNKDLYDEGGDYITWDIVVNAGGNAELNRELWLRDSFAMNSSGSGYENPNIGFYSPYTTTDRWDSVEVFAAQGYSNGSYNPKTLIPLYPEDPQGLRNKYVKGIWDDGKTDHTGGLVVHLPTYYNGSHQWQPQGTPEGFRTLVVRVKTKKLRDVGENAYYHNSTRFEKHDLFHGRVNVTSTDGGNRGLVYAAHYPTVAYGDAAVPLLTSVSLRKVDYEGNVLGQSESRTPAEFLVYGADESGAKGELMTRVKMVDGTYSLDSLSAPATLYFDEVLAPSGYYPGDSKNYKLEIDAKGNTTFMMLRGDGQWITLGSETPSKTHSFDIVNAQYPSLRLMKRNSSDKTSLLGAIFELTGPDGYVQTLGSPVPRSVFDFDFLRPGSYTLVEKRAPSGYLDATENSRWTFTVGEDESRRLTLKDFNGPQFLSVQGEGCAPGDDRALTCFDIPNVRRPDLRLKKVDSANHEIALAGVEFTLEKKKEDGDSFSPYPNASESRFITRVDGGLSFPLLPIGEYRLRETKPVDGYLVPDKPILFAVKDSGLIEMSDAAFAYQDGVLTITNEKKPEPMTLLLRKVMNREGGAPGQDQCVDNQGAPVNTADCGILMGSLTMTLSGPAGAGSPTTVTKTWDLASAWTEHQIDGKTVRALELPIEGTMPSGDYVLAETEAPVGFAATDATWKLRVDQTARTISWVKPDGSLVLLHREGAAPSELPLVIPNDLVKNPSLPLTGSAGVGPYAIAAMLLIAVGAAGARRRRP